MDYRLTRPRHRPIRRRVRHMVERSKPAFSQALSRPGPDDPVRERHAPGTVRAYDQRPWAPPRRIVEHPPNGSVERASGFVLGGSRCLDVGSLVGLWTLGEVERVALPSRSGVPSPVTASAASLVVVDVLRVRACRQIFPGQIPVRAAAAVNAAEAVPLKDLLAQGCPPCFASAVRPPHGDKHRHDRPDLWAPGPRLGRVDPQPPGRARGAFWR